jgi:hypothetical protein
LANLSLRQKNPDEAVGYLEPALAFYQQGGYRSESFSCLALLARAKLEKGDNAGAINADEKLLQLAEESNDQSLKGLAQTELASALAREERLSEALDHYSQAYLIYKSEGLERNVGYNLQGRSDALWRLGRYQEAQLLLDEASTIADKPNGGHKQLSANIKLAAAEMALSQGRSGDAKDRAEKVILAAGTQFPDSALDAKRVLGLAQAYGGAVAAGKQRCADAVEVANGLHDSLQLARAQLALAEVLLLANDAQGALTAALQAQESFARGEQKESEWRAWLIAALASQKRGEANRARDYALKATEALSSLQQRWGAENYNSYLSRPDIQRFRKQLSEVTGTQK